LAKNEWATPQELVVPLASYFVIEGQGDPNGEAFGKEAEALYTLAYTVRMAPRNKLELPGWQEFKVAPLEGVWSLIVPEPGPVRKENLKYRVMLRQPDFLTPEAAETVRQVVLAKKKSVELVKTALFETATDGRCVQMLHLGPYETERVTFQAMADFCRKESLARVGKTHREIYLSDPRRVAPEARKTLLRFPVRDDYSCV